MATPRLVYDDDCGFCTRLVAFADRHGEFDVVGFAELTREDRVRLPANYDTCVHLLTDESVYSCGEATEQVVARLDPRARRTFDSLRGVPGYAGVREKLYRWVSDRRALWGRVLSRESL